MKNNQKGFGLVEALIIAVVIAIIVGICWSIFKAQENKGNPSSNAPQTTTEKKSKDDEYYKIEQHHLEIKLDDQTKDLIAKVEGNRIYFTLTGFLSSANAVGYSLVIDGKNNCERLAGIVLFKDAAEVRAQSTEVTGELIDGDGKPIENRVILLNDGRYAEPLSHQASCASSSSFDGSTLQEQETNANAAIRKVIRNSLRSY